MSALLASRKCDGRPTSRADAQIASIAHIHRAIVATRNVKDFEGVDVSVVNPWAVGGAD